MPQDKYPLYGIPLLTPQPVEGKIKKSSTADKSSLLTLTPMKNPSSGTTDKSAPPTNPPPNNPSSSTESPAPLTPLAKNPSSSTETVYLGEPGFIS